jgi:DUF1680 family protein
MRPSTLVRRALLASASLLFISASCLFAEPSATLYPPTAVRITGGPFALGIEANRAYLLKHDVDRLLAPFRTEAGLEPRKPIYGDWEVLGLGGHTAGHYLSALSGMIAEGADTPDGELRRRLDYMLSELELCQQASPDGYLGGVPGSRQLWADVAAGRIKANGFGLNDRWVPWYNLHKLFAGLRDAYLVAGNPKARTLFVRCGDWCDHLLAGLSDEQVQDMLRAEQGGMLEVLTDLYDITHEERFLKLARRFVHHAVMDPLMRQEDKLTGLHANTQIPKVIGLERLGLLGNDPQACAGARFFWDTVTSHRSVAFGGNSVSEHFNDPKNFIPLLEHREGPETCNSYNMLRLTEQLFSASAEARYADYYERTLYNHILASLDPSDPGFVYFTPLRPGHYRVYSVPERHFWCCVGSGIENPGRYGRFIYAHGAKEVYVNLFIDSELNSPEFGMMLRQETAFPDKPSTSLRLTLEYPRRFALKLRRPAWAEGAGFVVRVNGAPQVVDAAPGSYVSLDREWKGGDRIEVEFPMHTRVEGLPDGSAWNAILYGPILLASPVATESSLEFRPGENRSAHIARGPLLPLDKVPVLLTDAASLPPHVVAVPSEGPLHFRLKDVVEPASGEGLPLVPFFRLHNSRYQMYWELTTPAGLVARHEKLAAAERLKLARDAATIDSVAIGEQQPEVDHGYYGEGSESGEFNGRRWRHGRLVQYTLSLGKATEAELSVTYNGGDRDRNFDILVNDQLLATVKLKGERMGEFFDVRYQLPAGLLKAARDGRLVIRFRAHENSLAGGLFDVRLLRPGTP